MVRLGFRQGLELREPFQGRLEGHKILGELYEDDRMLWGHI